MGLDQDYAQLLLPIVNCRRHKAGEGQGTRLCGEGRGTRLCGEGRGTRLCGEGRGTRLCGEGRGTRLCGVLFVMWENPCLHIQPYSVALNELFVECRYAERVPLFTQVVAMFHASPIFYSSILYSL